jgi:hypothetical protein
MVTRHASGEDTVGSAFTLGNVGAAVGGGQMAPTSVTIKNNKKGAKGGKKGQTRHPRHLALVTNHDNEEI